MSEPTASDIMTALTAAQVELAALVAQATDLIDAADAFQLSPSLSGNLNTKGFQIYSSPDGEMAPQNLEVIATLIDLDAAQETRVRKGTFPELTPQVVSGTTLALTAAFDGKIIELLGSAPCTVTLDAAFLGMVTLLNPAERTHEVVAQSGAMIGKALDGVGEASISFSGRQLVIHGKDSTTVEVY
jgi:hypothetical protein